MGRPEPCVLFSQTFVHSQLEEYVDEVIFAEPVVITSCEFLEQNASSVSPVITLLGATSPPSFALEVFVQSEGETRFRRLCQPFLYSHSSSNVLEVEAVVTNHLVVRGCYRSLSLVIYGNTAEDLGQFNIEFDLDSSLTNVVCSSEGKLDDLPPALHSKNLTIEESISSLNVLSLPVAAFDISIEIRQFLQLLFKILELTNLGDAVHKVLDTVVSAASSYTVHDLHYAAVNHSNDGPHFVLDAARKELLDIYKTLLDESGNFSSELLEECSFLESEIDLASSKELMDMLIQHFHFKRNFLSVEHCHLSQKKKVILVLSVALFLCSAKESCFHFVNGGGMEQLACVFSDDLQNSTAITLMLLGVVEQATRYSIGCEGFLGWWPREDDNVPSGVSEGYSRLLKLLLQKQRHDIASLATYALHRLRFYEVVSRYECAVLSVLGGLSTVGRITGSMLDMLISAKVQLKKLLKLINSRGPIEDPSPVACASRSLILGQIEGLSYKATSNLIGLSNCCFSSRDIDIHLLALLKERGFLPLSAALLSSSILRSEVGHAMDIFVDITASIEAIILSLLFCRSGLIFLLLHPELSATVILALRGVDDFNKEDCAPIRFASILISKGFFFRPREVGLVIEMHLRVVNAVDRLISSTPQSEEFLWVLWDLCGLSRSDCGRQALLALGHFPEAVLVLMEALHSVKELEPVTTTGTSPLNLAIFHSASEIFEVLVTDSTASSLASWIGHALELHKALHSSSPGSNRKDAPTRLLEWIDAGVVFHKNGVTGLLRYAAVLASGGDAHLTSTSILGSDSMDVENTVGDSTSGSDTNVIENLGKLVSEKSFDGVTLRDSSVAQLTTAFRILAFISENSAVAAALYDEGAIIVIYAVLVDCRFMLERSSNNYDYLVDEGTECNSTSDLLLERNREKSLVDLLIPLLVLLITLLQKLQEAKEQHRNTKLMNALLRLHREISPKLAACAADLSSSYPDAALGFGVVCNLLVSALACWPIYGWTPGLFHSLLVGVQATSSLALGPKETCSLLCILNDLFPEEGVWLWKNGMPLLSAVRTLAVGTLLGSQKEKEVNWYLHPGHPEVLLNQLTPHLDKISQVILHYTMTSLVVIQDMLRVFILRIACQKADNASLLLQPIMSWIRMHLSESSCQTDGDAYKIYRLLDFLACLLEHPCAKPLLLKEDAIQMLIKALERCVDAAESDGKQLSDGRISAKCGLTAFSWCLPLCKSLSLICDSQISQPYTGNHVKNDFEHLSSEDCSLILPYLLKLCQILPVGRELLACLTVFKELGSCNEGQNALMAVFLRIRSGDVELEQERGHERGGSHNVLTEYEWKKLPPLLCCWTKLLRSVDPSDSFPTYAIEAVGALSLGALCFCVDGKSLDLNRVSAMKFLFGLPHDLSGKDDFPEENIRYIQELTTLLSSKVTDDDYSDKSDMKTIICRASDYAKTLLLMLQNSASSLDVGDIVSGEDVALSPNDVLLSSRIHQMIDNSVEKVEDCCLGLLEDKFLWECPETLPDRLLPTNLPAKRKMPSLEGPSRRARGENSPAETVAQGAFPRALGPPSASSGPSRRDTFRLRKPNTSRPPSMHVDDYVARERNVDGVSNSNVIAVQRIGTTGGRPPSIHVDEFMARQRERQNPVALAVGEVAAQVKNAVLENGADTEKFNKSKHIKAELDDDLQGIDIVFDGEESEPDEKLHFPQPDDNLPSVIVEHSSPHSIVEETESDVNENSQFSRLGTPLALNANENTESDFSSRMSVSRPEMPLTREPSVSSEKKYFEQPDDMKNAVPAMTPSRYDSAGVAISSGFPASAYGKGSASSVPVTVDSRMSRPNFYSKNTSQSQQAGTVPLTTGSQGLYDQKFMLNQPPLPPMPPPPTISPIISQAPDPALGQSSPFVNTATDVQPPLPNAFQVQSEYLSSFNNSSTSLATSLSMPDSKYSRASLSSPSGSARPPPPLPPTPPPFSAAPFTLPSLKVSVSPSSVYNQTSGATADLPQISGASLNDARLVNLSASGSRLSSYPHPQGPHLVFSRPASMPVSIYGSTTNQQQGENPSNTIQNPPIPQLSIQSIQSFAQLQPLQPPQHLRPPQPPQHLRPPVQPSQQPEQGVSLLQSPIQLPVQPLQMLQQPQVSPIHVYYQQQQQENFSHVQHQQQVEHAQPQVLRQQVDSSSQLDQDAGMSLQQYFSSPEAIQSLLSDRDKLCQLLEQHPKLMQMLQERLGQL